MATKKQQAKIDANIKLSEIQAVLKASEIKEGDTSSILFDKIFVMLSWLKNEGRYRDLDFIVEHIEKLKESEEGI